MSIIVDAPRVRPLRRAPITSETRARFERADAAPGLSTIYDGIIAGGERDHYRVSALTEAQRAYSLRRSIRRCGQAGHRCGGALCARCSAARSGQFRRELTASLRNERGSLASWTATVATSPSAGVRQQWDDLLAALQATIRGGWLARQGVSGTARVIEISRGLEGWHIHAHILLTFRSEISAEDFGRFALTVESRYLSEADRLGIPVSANAQDIQRTRSARAWTHYLSKGHVRTNGTDTPSQLWTAVQAGDADALALVHDLEAGSFRRRMFTTTGVCRPLPDFDDLLRSGALD